MKLSLVFSFIALMFLNGAGAYVMSAPNDFSCTTVPIVTTVAPRSGACLRSTGFLFETYSGAVDVLGSPSITSGHDKPTVAGLSGARIEVLSLGHSLQAHSLNSTSDLSFMELAGNTKSRPMQFDFASAHNKLADAHALMSIAIVDSSITSLAPVDTTLPGVHQLIAGDGSPRSTQFLIAPMESINAQFSIGANADTATLPDALVPEAGTLHYGLLGICLLMAKFRWDGTRDRRIRRETKTRHVS